MVTGAGTVPGAAIQPENGAPALLSSNAIRRRSPGSGASFMAPAANASMNNNLAPQSCTIAAKSRGVEDGASGATATPARSAPRNVTTYSAEDSAQIAMLSHGWTPSRCKAAVTRLIWSLNAA